jgi:hypothetical protein
MVFDCCLFRAVEIYIGYKGSSNQSSLTLQGPPMPPPTDCDPLDQHLLECADWCQVLTQIRQQPLRLCGIFRPIPLGDG